jgi:hypothetical protein
MTDEQVNHVRKILNTACRTNGCADVADRAFDLLKPVLRRINYRKRSEDLTKRDIKRQKGRLIDVLEVAISTAKNEAKVAR